MRSASCGRQALRRALSRPAALIAGLCLSLSAVCAQAETPRLLSEHATLSLLTIWPGNEIYLAFGHSALRVKDPGRGLDLIFNYGTFDLRDPLFIPKFVKGDLYYYLAYYPFKPDFDYDMRAENRAWYEQVLNLDQGQVEATYRFLLQNALPQNRYYRYDFILDNCATRIRDALKSVLGPVVHYDPANREEPHKSYRQMIGEFVSDRPFYRFMFYPVLGRAADRPVTSFESQFLPLYMMKVFSASSILRDGREVPLVSESRSIYMPSSVVYRGKRWADPSFLIWPFAAACIVLSALGLSRARKRMPGGSPPVGIRLLDGALFLSVGILGCIVFYLSFFSAHAAAQGNLNVVWMLPTHIVAAGAVLRRRAVGAFWSWYFLLSAVAAAGPVMFWSIWPQGIHPGMIGLMLAVMSRSLSRFWEAWRYRRIRY